MTSRVAELNVKILVELGEVDIEEFRWWYKVRCVYARLNNEIHADLLGKPRWINLGK
jgi:hypothetical protein